MKMSSLLDKTSEQSPSSQNEDVAFEYLALGTNKEKTPVKDLVRMPGTKWCGIGWRTDTVQQFGGYAGTDRYIPPASNQTKLETELLIILKSRLQKSLK